MFLFETIVFLMGITLRHSQACMAKELLNKNDISTIIETHGCVCMSPFMRTYRYLIGYL